MTYTVPNTGEIAVNFVSRVVALEQGAVMPTKKSSVLILLAGESPNEIIAVGSSQGLLNHILDVIQRQ